VGAASRIVKVTEMKKTEDEEGGVLTGRERVGGNAEGPSPFREREKDKLLSTREDFVVN